MLDKALYMEVLFHNDAKTFEGLDSTEGFRYSTLIDILNTFRCQTEIFLKMLDNKKLCFILDIHRDETFKFLSRIKKHVELLNDQEYTEAYNKLYLSFTQYNLAYDENQRLFSEKMEELEKEFGAENWENFIHILRNASKKD